ncbi:UvrB/UvrC motif-containing protein [Staphylococcus lutrae]|uniref:Excinuclease ABC subunit B n=1 Tax=Staphylococcus lutrae TaxID=155085 RepID=A0AAC9RSZ1_9STAP|nr:UvrB/UvrC motif-containing protein [Staphylococcus lutrae]ARJ51071.1 excinuclease ABC subunit B [Staphylococcus lutrae]PNZ38303.1 excinuclease ABC subunit B [Staphylococcus lutrae]
MKIDKRVLEKQHKDQHEHLNVRMYDQTGDESSDAQWHEGDDVEGTFVIQQILQHLAAKHGLSVDQVVYREQKRCPNCQMTLKDIAHVGKFGCHQCYQTFKEDVYDIVRRVQGGHIEHAGKCPKSAQHQRAIKKQLEAKRARLDQLVAQQAFEEAAVVRDEIQALERQSEVSRQDGE